MTHFVRGVSAASTEDAVTFRVSPISAKTGVAAALNTASITERQTNEGITTSSPAPIPIARSPSSIAVLPLFTGKTYFIPRYWRTAVLNCSVDAPRTTSPAKNAFAVTANSLHPQAGTHHGME